MSASPATAAASASAAAAQDDGDGGFWSPAWPALAVILATLAVAIWILVDDDDGGGLDIDVGEPVSPA
jgi:hypothetical protein